MKYHTGTYHCRLPPHISLKQPFPVADLPALEAYVDELANSLPPVAIDLSELQAIPISAGGQSFGLLWADVANQAELHPLHDRVNRELFERFGSTPAEHDGAEYHFHMTVTMGGQPYPVYQQYLSELDSIRLDRRFVSRQLALFLYDEPMGMVGEYLTYKIVPLGG